jgi:hypothetical protein
MAGRAGVDTNRFGVFEGQSLTKFRGS